MSQIFTFKQQNRNLWERITNTLNKQIFATKKQVKGDFEVEIRPLKKKRSVNQLRAYWLLIRSVKNWMNEKGNCFTDEQVSDYFKMSAGHVIGVGEFLLPKSIANKSDCTREQMEALINTILVFGAQNLIADCYIEDRELQELLNYYK